MKKLLFILPLFLLILSLNTSVFGVAYNQNFNKFLMYTDIDTYFTPGNVFNSCTDNQKNLIKAFLNTYEHYVVYSICGTTIQTNPLNNLKIYAWNGNTINSLYYNNDNLSFVSSVVFPSGNGYKTYGFDITNNTINYISGNSLVLATITKNNTSNYIHMLTNTTLYTDNTKTDTISNYVPIPAERSYVHINLPLDNFKDNSSIFALSVYSKILKNDFINFDVSKLSYIFKYDNDLSFVDNNLYNLIRNKYVDENSTDYVFTFNADIGLPVGVHIVKLYVYYDNNLICSAEKPLERLAGFVDTDGNGLDDRTGRTDGNITDITSNQYNEITENSNFLDIIANTKTTFESFAIFFSMLPGFIWALVGTALTIAIALRILGR